MPEGSRATIAVIAAMKEEIEPLGRRLRARASGSADGVAWTRGRLRDADLVVAATGEGRRNAAAGAERILRRHRPARVLGIGLAAALTETLAVGEVVLSGEVRDGSDPVPEGPDREWLERACRLTGCAAGRLVTVDEILATPAAKARWRDGEDPRHPAVADMESASWARVATAHRLPYLVARAVSDLAGETLPSFLECCRNRDGGIDRRAVLRYALPRPGSWSALLRLRGRLARCARRLADLTETVVAAG